MARRQLSRKFKTSHCPIGNNQVRNVPFYKTQVPYPLHYLTAGSILRPYPWPESFCRVATPTWRPDSSIADHLPHSLVTKTVSHPHYGDVGSLLQTPSRWRWSSACRSSRRRRSSLATALLTAARFTRCRSSLTATWAVRKSQKA